MKEVTMRVVHATALTAAVLLLASVASAQGLGDAAAREKEKRKASPAKPAKVYTEGDIGPSMVPASTTPDLPAPGDTPPGDQPSAGAGEGGARPADAAAGASPAQSEEDARAKAQDAWRQQLEQARKEEALYKDVVDKMQLQLNDTSGMYSPARASAIASLEENKQKLARAQAKVALLEEEGRRNLYR